MNQSDAMLVVKELAPVFRQFVAEAVAPLAAQIAALEARPVQAGIAGALKSETGVLILTLSDGRTLDTGVRDGRDAEPVTLEAFRPIVSDEVGKQVAALPRPKDGEDARPDQIAEAVEVAVAQAKAELEAETIAAVDAAFAAIPKGPEGPTVDEVKEIVAERLAEAFAEIPPVPELPDIPAMIEEVVDRVVAEIPPAEPGKDADPDVIRTMVAEAVAALPKNSGGPTRDEVDALVQMLTERIDGCVLNGADVARRHQEMIEAIATRTIGMAGGFIDRDGNLVLTSTDGKTHPVGHIVGKDGDPGKPGFGFEHIGVDYDGERTITITFTRGGEVKAFPIVMPIVLDRGVYKEGRGYEPGDGVTWGGCYWIAGKRTTEKPGANDDWRLTVRKGRDGKAPKPTEKG